MSPSSPSMHPSPREEIDLRDLWRTLRRSWYLILASIVLGGGGAYLLSKSLTKIYSATTVIWVDDHETPVPRLGEAAVSPGKAEVNTEMQLLQSQSLAVEVMDSLGLRLTVTTPEGVITRKVVSSLKVPTEAPPSAYLLTRHEDGTYLVTDTTGGTTFGTAVSGKSMTVPGLTFTLADSVQRFPVIRLDVLSTYSANAAFGKVLSVNRPDRVANTIEVSYRTPDPLLARDVPNVLAERYLARRAAMMKVGPRGTAAFLRSQLDAVNSQLADAEAGLRGFREREQIVSPVVEASAQVTRIAQLQARRSDLESERLALKSALTELESIPASQPGEPSPYRRLLAFPSLLRNPVAVGLLDELTTVEGQRLDLLGRRTPADPDVQVLAGREREIENQVGTLLTSYVEGLSKEVAQVDSSLNSSIQEAGGVPARDIQLAKLERRSAGLAEIGTLLQTRLKEAEISEALSDASVQVVDPATVPESPVFPRLLLILAAGLLLGTLLGLGLAFSREWMDSSIHTRRDLEEAVGVPVLGLIPHMARLGLRHRRLRLRAPRRGRGDLRVYRERLVAGRDPKGPVSEAYRTLRTNLAFESERQLPKTLVLVSPTPGDGKTTSIANLAVALVQQGMRVLVIDADMRRGILNRIFDTRRDPGLSDYLAGRVELKRAIRPIHLKDGGTIDLIPTGIMPENPADLVGSSNMRKLVEGAAAEYDVVLIDTPPLNLFADAVVLASLTDGVLLVARAGKTATGALTFAAEQLRRARVQVLGALLNDYDPARDSRGEGKYDYYGPQQYAYATEKAAR